PPSSTLFPYTTLFRSRRLIDPMGLLQHAVAEAERLEHLHGPAGNAVSLPEQQRTGLLLDDPGDDVGKRRQLGCQRQAGGSATDRSEEHTSELQSRSDL